ncbi:MAG TPA: type III-B CRISPR module RAMP protein Cmr6 [Streptosporangiaceae bacterium]|nr:type III-B CRISPR module RAMP protein Cmr6 [Streptosporangiaceae bacterium]
MPDPRPRPPRGRRAAPARTGQADRIPAAGPLGSVIFRELVKGAQGDWYRLGGFRSGPGANALIMLNRVAFIDPERQRLDDGGKRALIRWACQERLGQDDGLVADVAHRREAVLRALAARSRHCVRLRAQPEWRLAIGLGNKANAHEIGLALHGTYGWPVIPGSALKGLTAAWAAASDADPRDVWRVLGSPRSDVRLPPAGPDDPGRWPGPAPGTVCFLDAIPDQRPVAVEADVFTPHVKPYYDSMTRAGGAGVPPAEYHNPVPLTFLTVRGLYTVDLYGKSGRDVRLAADWLKRAGDELGAGAKTAAGYGYLSVDEEGVP